MMVDLSYSPRFYRTAIAVLAASLALVAAVNFYRFTTSTTDENLFRDAPSQISFTRSFPTTRSLAAGTSNMREAYVEQPDSVRMGDLLIAINSRRIGSVAQVRDILAGLAEGDELDMEIFRTSEDKYYSCRIQVSALPDSFSRTLPPAVYVFDVAEGGASDLAGLRIGDLIHKINGKEFSSAQGADAILLNAMSGETILYDVIRNDQAVVVPVTLARFGLQLGIFLFFLTGVVYWGTGSFIAHNRPDAPAARLLGLAFIVFGFFLMVMTQRAPLFDLFAKFRTVLWASSIPFGLALWTQSKFYFPSARPELLENPWLARVSYLAATVISATFALMILGKLGTVLLAQVLISVGIVGMMVYSWVLHFIFRDKRPKEDKKVRNFLTAASTASLLVAFATGFALYLTGHFMEIGYSGLALLGIPFSYLYVIGHYQLLEMKLRIKRSVKYIIVTSVWGALLVIVLLKILLALPELYLDIPNFEFTGGRFVVLDIPPDPKLHDFWERLVMIFLALVTTFAFWRIGKAGQRLIDRRFNRRTFNLSHATGEMAEVMATKLGMTDLARGIIERLARLMELKRVGVMFFRDQRMCCCHEAYGFDGSEWNELCLYSGEKMIRELNRFRSESRFSVDYLPEEIKVQFQEKEFRHVIPIRFKDKLVGTFIIGEKLSETPLHIEDLAFLSAVAKQASIAIENAFLHEELTEQERLKHELKIARRIQMASLPQETPQVDGLDISGISIPALEVGGDYFDYLNGVSPGLTIIVGDVSGKGTSAALYMSKVQGIIRSLHTFDLSPAELFIRANTLLWQDMEKKSFVTAIGACVDTKKRTIVLARAGHLPLFYYESRSQNVSLLTPKGLGLGLDKEDTFAGELEEHVLSYASGDVFLFVTDGVTEAQTVDGREFGEEKLIEVLAANVSYGAEAIRDNVLAAVSTFVADAVPHDDQTVVVVKVK